MSDRSRLLKKVLETWESSDEGEQYLNWLLQPEAAELDGGDILREAVLDTLEEDEQLQRLRRREMAQGLQELCADVQLSNNDVETLENSTAGILAGFSKQAESIRSKTRALAEIRHVLDKDRLETLMIVSQLMNSGTANEIQQFFKQLHLREDLAARVASLSRTSTEFIDPEQEWRQLSPDGPSFEDLERSANKSAGDWFDLVSERLDMYYSHQLLSRLETIVQRGAALTPMKLLVKNGSIHRLFREAHDAYLYGFDAASIALCRSLLDQALRDKLAVQQNEQPSLAKMIRRAEREKLLDRSECDHADKVREAGNDVVHDISKMPSPENRVQDVLASTRVVLNKLYGA